VLINTVAADSFTVLLNEFNAMANYFGCTDLEVLQLDAIDVVNVLDTNKDGLLITYQIRSFE